MVRIPPVILTANELSIGRSITHTDGKETCVSSLASHAMVSTVVYVDDEEHGIERR